MGQDMEKLKKQGVVNIQKNKYIRKIVIRVGLSHGGYLYPSLAYHDAGNRSHSDF